MHRYREGSEVVLGVQDGLRVHVSMHQMATGSCQLPAACSFWWVLSTRTVLGMQHAYFCLT